MTTTFAPVSAAPPPGDVPDSAWLRDEVRVQPRLLLRGELLAQGFTDNHIRKARRDGALVVLGQGRYLSELDWHELDDRGRYLVLLRATLAGVGGDPVVSHASAAILHGIALPPAQPQAVDIIGNGPAKSRSGAMIRMHRGLLDAAEIVRCEGLAVTSMARTVVDWGLTQSTEAAVVVIRHVLAAGSSSPVELWAQVRRQERTPGVRAVAATLTAVLGELQSPGDLTGPLDGLQSAGGLTGPPAAAGSADQPATVIRTASGVPVAAAQS